MAYRLRDSDKRVIKAFAEKRSAKPGHVLETDGEQLYKMGMGGGVIAEWRPVNPGDHSFQRIVFAGWMPSVQSDQTIMRYMHEVIPAFDFMGYKRNSGGDGMLRPNLKNLKELLMPYNQHLREPLTPRKLGALSRELMDAEGTTRGVEEALEHANELLEGFGVEAIDGNGPGGFWWDSVCHYVNMGDMYSPTIFYDTIKGRFYVGDVGTFVEVRGDRYGVQ